MKSLTPGLCGHLREAVKEVPMCRVTERWVARGGGRPLPFQEAWMSRKVRVGKKCEG